MKEMITYKEVDEKERKEMVTIRKFIRKMGRK